MFKGYSSDCFSPRVYSTQHQSASPRINLASHTVRKLSDARPLRSRSELGGNRARFLEDFGEIFSRRRTIRNYLLTTDLGAETGQIDFHSAPGPHDSEKTGRQFITGT